ncbi:Asp23/Gls24 family envelope stress response protein [Frigoribacterium sp. ME-P-080]|uniref:Asp23/Gls24 family envelope stress response protein n=1 Tax=Frigoribacterium sp. ME-P-080 TaxID=3040289 RepID=UPI00254D72DA|nr:Asp23/Gls24 family envelope stress response protein [Frigoribacterium sp. ME-P-080]
MSDRPHGTDHAHEDPTPPDVPVDLGESVDPGGSVDPGAPVDPGASVEPGAPGDADPSPDELVDGIDDGVSPERLVDYLDAGRQPYDPEIEESPEARAQLAALERLRAMGARLLESDAAASPAPDPSWISGVMDRVRLESRAGRQIPLASIDERSTLHITEGAVRSLIREAGDGVDGAMVISCTILGDVSVPGALVRVEVVVSGLFGEPLPALAEAVKSAVSSSLSRQTELTLESVDVVVDDVHLQSEGGAA